MCTILNPTPLTGPPLSLNLKRSVLDDEMLPPIPAEGPLLTVGIHLEMLCRTSYSLNSLKDCFIGFKCLRFLKSKLRKGGYVGDQLGENHRGS